MPIFEVRATLTVSCWTQVEADSEAEALQIAADRSVSVALISEPVSESWHYDTDGTPIGIRIDND